MECDQRWEYERRIEEHANQAAIRGSQDLQCLRSQNYLASEPQGFLKRFVLYSPKSAQS